MNRRNFLKNIIVAGASFSILPGAGRIWKAIRSPICEWKPFQLYPYQEEMFTREYECVFTTIPTRKSLQAYTWTYDMITGETKIIRSADIS